MGEHRRDALCHRGGIANNCGTCYAISMQTTVSVDKSGRLVVPKELRQAMGLRGAGKLELDVIDGKLVGQPAVRKASLVRTGNGLRAFKVKADVSAREAVRQMRQDRYS